MDGHFGGAKSRDRKEDNPKRASPDEPLPRMYASRKKAILDNYPIIHTGPSEPGLWSTHR